MKLKDNSTQEIDTALYQLEQKLKSNIRLTDVENSNASTAKINAVDKKLTEEVKDRQSADEKLQNNINKEIADRKKADAAIENAKQDKLIAGNNIQIDGNVISATSTEYTAEAPVRVTDGKISLDTVPVNKGGTGVTTQSDINKAFISNLYVGNDNVTDGTEFVSSWAGDNGFADPEHLNKPFKRKFSTVWNYIKDKISSVLGLTATNYSGTSDKATNDGDGNNIVNTYALKSNLQYTKSIYIMKSNGSSNTYYYLIAETIGANNTGNIDSLFVNGSDFMNRMFEGSIRTREGNVVYNYGKDNLPIELYEQTDGTIYVYWLVSDTYNRVVLNIAATEYIAIYGGDLSPVAPTGSKMTLNEYDFKSCETLPVGRGGTGVTTQEDINKAFISNLEAGNSDVTDGTEFVSSYTSDNGFAETAEGALNKPYKRQFIKVWNYIKDKISSVLGLTKDNYGGTAATILDYNRNTPIKVRCGGPGIDSADWYPAFSADGSAIEPINKANIRVGNADRTTGINYTGESDGCISAQQTSGSYNNSEASWASYIICNHGNGTTYYHQMLRLPFFSDSIQLQRRVDGELQGWKNVAIMENENTWQGRQNFTTAKASSKMVIPIGEPSSLEDGCIWIER